MGDLPLTTGRTPFGRAADASEGGDVLGDIPAWLAARRSRTGPVKDEPADQSTSADELEIEFDSLPDPECCEEVVRETERVPATAISSTDEPPMNVVLPPPLPAPGLRLIPESDSEQPSFPLLTPTIAPRSFPASWRPWGPFESALRISDPVRKGALPIPEQLPPAPADLSWKETIVHWVRSAGMKGVLVSMLVHAVILSVLALIVIGGGKVHEALDILGVVGDPSDELLTSIELGSAITIDPADSSGGPDFADVSQFVSGESTQFNPAEAIRGGSGGKGSGGAGDGDATALPPVNVPKYAVTKGSFSAWTEPRDPEPGQMYEIIIQFRLPANVKTYRGSDLTGMVVGTDLYKQAIKFQRNESFPVVDGAVRIKIPVPGGGRLVRDTIRIESKILREKQVLEIEF